jgi:hypothetical protein
MTYCIYEYLKKFVGFMAVTTNITVYWVVTPCILVDMHPAYGAACSSETAINLIPESGNILCPIYVKTEERIGPN